MWLGYGLRRSSGSEGLLRISSVFQRLNVSCRECLSDLPIASPESESSDWETESTISGRRARLIQDRRQYKTGCGKARPNQQSAAWKDGLATKFNAVSTSRELLHSLPKDRPATKTLKGHARIKPDRKSQLEPLLKDTRGSWMQRPRETLIWLKDSYRDEIVFY